MGGLIVLDDFTPMTTRPPTHLGRPDAARMHWLTHPRLRTAEVKVTPSAATIVATYFALIAMLGSLGLRIFEACGREHQRPR